MNVWMTAGSVVAALAAWWAYRRTQQVACTIDLESTPQEFHAHVELDGAIACGAYAARALTATGVVAAVVLGTVVYGFGGWKAASVLVAFFVGTSLLERTLKHPGTSPVRIYTKSSRRDGSHVAANGSADALFVVIGYLLPQTTWPWVAFAGSVAAVTADTWATEMGALSPTAPRLITRMAQQVRPGTSGGITFIGTAAAVLGGFLIGALAALLAPWSGTGLLLPIAIGGLLGALFDSVLGATVQGMYECPTEQVETEQYPRHACGARTVHVRGWRWLNNEVVNLASSFVGALTALLLAWFNRGYQLQRFSTSFVLLAARHRAPVIPVYMINAEWINPFGYVFPPLDRLMQRFFGVPFLPLPAGILAIIFPWIWYLAFPARTIFVLGAPIDVRQYLTQAGMTNFEEPDRPTLQRTAERVRQEMQLQLDALVRIHGRRPYDAPHLWAALKAGWGKLRWVLPTGWPISFVRRTRDEHRPPARNALHRILRDWDLVGFYLPFGWPLLTLARMFRKPPCGYRGVPRTERAERQGAFMWRLSDRPLPPRPSRPPA